MDLRPLVATESSGTSPLDVVRLLHSGGEGLWVQAVLHARLASVEWQEEKQRLLRMLLITLLGFACLLCVMLFGGGLLLAATWDTAFRLPTLAALVLAYGAGTAVAWRHFQATAELGALAFAALREELATDAALLKENL